jgi:hypothetical protein
MFVNVAVYEPALASVTLAMLNVVEVSPAIALPSLYHCTVDALPLAAAVKVTEAPNATV